MPKPFVARRVDVAQRAERALVERHLGALVDDRALGARERQSVGLALEEVLPHLRPDLFEDEAQVGGDRIVAQHRVPGLDEIVNAEAGQRAEQRCRPATRKPVGRRRGARAEQSDAQDRKTAPRASARRTAAKTPNSRPARRPPPDLFQPDIRTWRRAGSAFKTAAQARYCAAMGATVASVRCSTLARATSIWSHRADRGSVGIACTEPALTRTT